MKLLSGTTSCLLLPLIAGGVSVIVRDVSAANDTTIDMSSLCGKGTMWSGESCISLSSICGTGAEWNASSKSCVATKTSGGLRGSNNDEDDATSTSAPSHSNEGGESSLDPFTTIDGKIQNCQGGLKLILVPSSSYSYSVSPTDNVEAVVSPSGALTFQSNEGSGSIYTVTVNMPADKLRSLNVDSSTVVVLQPGFKLNTFELMANGGAQVYSPSFCAKTLSLDASEGAHVSLTLPPDCKDVQIPNLSANFGAGMSVDSKAEGGKVAHMDLKYGSQLYVNMDVESLNANQGSTYYAKHIESRNTPDANEASAFQDVKPPGITVSDLNPDSLQCYY